MEPGFLDLMRQTVSVKAWLKDSTDGYGAPQYSTVAATTVRARVVAKPRRLVRPDGHEIVSSHVAWLASTASVSVKDKVTFAGSTYAILALERPTDERGVVHHTKLFLGLA